MAAVLAGGPGAVLSHASAAAAWDLRRSASGLIHVTVPSGAGRERRAGLRLHRSATLTSRDVAEVRGVPVTSVARTIIDLSRTLKGRELEALVDRADQRGIVDFAALRAATPASLQAVLRSYAPAATRSEPRSGFSPSATTTASRDPRRTPHVEGFEVDFVWRDRRLIVEVDGYAYHRSPSTFEDDRERDVRLQIAVDGAAVHVAPDHGAHRLGCCGGDARGRDILALMAIAAPFYEKTDEQKAITEMVRQFVDEQIIPQAEHYDDEDEFPEPIVEQMKELGLFGITIPEEYGGMGLDLTTYAMIVEELSRGWISISGVVNTHFIGSYLLMKFGSEEQKQRLLPKMATGEIRAAFSLSEPELGPTWRRSRPPASRRMTGTGRSTARRCGSPTACARRWCSCSCARTRTRTSRSRA